jgi:hypothetical protein
MTRGPVLEEVRDEIARASRIIRRTAPAEDSSVVSQGSASSRTPSSAPMARRHDEGIPGVFRGVGTRPGASRAVLWAARIPDSPH